MDVWNSTQTLTTLSNGGEKLDEFKYRDRVEEQLHKDVEQLFANRYDLHVRGNFKKQDSLIVVDADALPVLDGIVITPEVFSTKDFLIEDSEEHHKTEKISEQNQTKQKKRRTSKTAKREKKNNNNASSDSSESTSESSSSTRSRKRTKNENDKDSVPKVPKVVPNLTINDSEDFPIDFTNKIQQTNQQKPMYVTNQPETQPVHISQLLEDNSFSHDDLAQHLMRPLVPEQHAQPPQSPQRASPYNVSNLDSSLFPVSMGSYEVRSPNQPSSPIQFTTASPPTEDVSKMKWEGILRNSQVPVTKTRAKWWWLLQAERNKVGEIGADTPSASMPTLPKFTKSTPAPATINPAITDENTPKLPARSKLKDLLDWVHQQNNPMALFSQSMPNLPIREKKSKSKDGPPRTEL